MKRIPSAKKKLGMVSLVGAGPGDPGLLTLKAKARLEAADIVFFDHLVHPDLLKHCPQAKLRNVGKRGYREAFPQKKIAQLLVEAARRHRRVVRLKGGDPFIFGRGGEEAEALAKAKIPFEIVPGVTSAVAVPAYAGIPLTHRRFASSVTFLTGHEGPKGKGEAPALDWAALAKQPTLVFLMGVKTLKKNFENLRKQGMDPKTPAALIEWGTYPRQRSLFGTLSSLPAQATRAKIQPPAIAVLGQVTTLSSQLTWFENRPLFARRILVTRGASQASMLSSLLEEKGAEALELPTLELQAPRSYAALDRALQQLKNYEGLIFSSPMGVDCFFERLQTKGIHSKVLTRHTLAVVGPATAERLRSQGFTASKVAKVFTSSHLARSFSKREIEGKSWLWVRAEEGREEGLEILRRRGAVIDLAPAYRSSRPKISPRRIKNLFQDNPPDLLTFASAAAARHFAEIVRTTPYWKTAKKIPSAVIGPVTRAAAQKSGLKVAVMPKRHTIPDMVDAIVKYFSD